MPTKTLYVREPDEPVWEAAARVAKRHQTTVSQLVAAALKDYLPRVADTPTPADRWAAVAAEPDAA